MTGPASPAASIAPLRCIQCGSSSESASQDLRCSKCGDLLEAVLPQLALETPEAERERAAGRLKAVWAQRRSSPAGIDQSGVWRFRELLPQVADPLKAISLREGNTPLYELPGCARSAGLDHLLAKHQGMNPTGSFKDTGMTVASSIARQAGFRWVACASTGNTSASMAAYAARAGMRSLVLIPEGKISWSKLAQTLDYGALTCQLRTDFDGCMQVLNEIVRRMPLYLLNSVNPYRIEGQKTAAIELLEQLNWEPPDHVIVPGGNLGNASAIGKALLEMRQLGFIRKLPAISIVQAEGANPFVTCVREHSGLKLEAVRAETMATAIRIGNPASWKKAVRVLEASGGTVEQVSEAEIALAKAEIGGDGVGCEPASAVTLAGVKKLIQRGFVHREQSVVLILTGHVLKDSDFTLKFHRGDLFGEAADTESAAGLRSQQRAPMVLEASVEAVLEVLAGEESEMPRS